MTALEALVLGIIQGLTEFLPVSSSGHLVFMPHIFGWAYQGLAFDVVVHMGTLVAVIFYFRKKLWQIVKSLFSKNIGQTAGTPLDSSSLPQTPSSRSLRSRGLPLKGGEETNVSRLGWFLLLSIIPAGLFGLLLGDFVETSLRSPWVVGVSLIFWAVVLAAADGFGKGLADKKANKDLEKITFKNVLFIALAQAIALIPGTSRSGITMTAGLFAKLDKKSAAEFSFLMSVPVITLAGVYKLFQVINNGTMGQWDNTFLVGFLASTISGFLAIKFLMKIIQKWSFMPFVVYRVAIGTLILFYLT